MFDTRLRQLIDPVLNRMGAWVARSGIGANAITLTGAVLVIPLFYSRAQRVAYWSHLAHPQELPYYGMGFPDVWWSKNAAK